MRESNEQRIEDKCYTNTNSNKNQVVNKKDKYSINFFIAGPERSANIKASFELTKVVHIELKDIYTGIGCFQETFSLQGKERAKPYQAPPRHVAYSLQKSFKDK